MNIEELARQAGMPMAWISEKGVLNWADLERFAALVKAEVLEKVAQTTYDGSIEGRIFAQAIRAMKPTREAK